ncbi:MAG: sugar ABC transporter ATP-binding protein [Actinobacteria bacterium]|nr:sugar ABC transporter ATP-binding protein [Actinomycetota bacterium]
MEKKVVLEVKELSKHFGGIKAVDKVNLKLFEKEIIAIVGDNGAGKSTLIKTISGVYKKDEGKIFVSGVEVEINDPINAKECGIETVYQDEGVISILDAPANLFLGREPLRKDFLGRAFKFIDYKYMRDETIKLLDRFGIELKDINAELSNLSGGQRQTITVGRAAYWGGRIIILDEPTNNLGVKQERRVLDLIKKLRDEYEVSIIVISHNIEHVFELVDRIIVLRNGSKVGERLKKETSRNEIVSMITGVAA